MTKDRSATPDAQYSLTDMAITRRQALLAGGALAVGIGLAASTSSNPTTPASNSKAVSKTTAKRGGSLICAVEGNGLKDIMDAQNDLAKIDQARLVTGWEPLLEFDRNFTLTTTGLAESCEPDGTLGYVVKLRRGVEFHNGKTLPPTTSSTRSSA